MFLVESYMENLIYLLKETFSKRLIYVGLQGSYLRNEADEDSDIDVMVVIENLSMGDLNSYKKILQGHGGLDKSCGFICGKEELACWNPLEICHLIHTTKDYLGKLTELVPKFTLENERNFIKISLNNLYHELCHGYIYASRDYESMKLKDAYKLTFFIIQNIYYLKTGDFILTKRELFPLIQEEEKKVLEMAIHINNQKEYEFDSAFELLFNWCQKQISQMSKRRTLAEVAREEALKGYHGYIMKNEGNIASIVRLFPNWTLEKADQNWCAAFVYYCCTLAGKIIPVRPKESHSCSLTGCIAWEEWALSDTRIEYHSGSERGFQPKSGDIVLYDRVFNNSEHDHIGILLENKCDSIVVAEGNINNISGVIERKKDDHIRAYIRIPEGFSY